MLTHVTFTGWDGQTDLAELRDFLADHRPRTIEIAVLASATTEPGRERYPVVPDASDIIEAAASLEQRTALHLCGRLARLALEDFPTFETSSASAYWRAVARDVDRVQVNVPEGFWPAHGAPEDRYLAAVQLAHNLGKPVIVQVRGDRFPGPLPGVVYLFDRSGGRGERSTLPPLPGVAEQNVGFAGGLGPANVAEVVRSIAASAWDRGRHPFWIDMETGIRELFPVADDNIGRGPSIVSVMRCREVMRAVGSFLEGA